MLKQAVLRTAVLAGAVTTVATLARRLKVDRRVPGRLLQPHTSETEREYREARHRVLILGAGFGGLYTALELDRQLHREHQEEGTSILLADRNNDLLFAPLLWIVANGR